MPSAWSAGTEVNTDVTSYELRHYPGINLLYWPVNKVFGAVDVVGGFTYQRLKYFGKYFSHIIGNRTNPTLNRNIGKYSLHHIWNRVLLNTPGLKIKRHAQAIGYAQNTQPNSPTPLNQPNTPYH